MSLLDFVIGNPGHHPAMFLPVLEELMRRGSSCRVLSLCELRGFDSPKERLAEAGVELIRMVPFNLRRSPSLGAQAGTSEPGPLRALARTLAWRVILASRFARALGRTQLVVLPNDSAFPYDRICSTLTARGIRFVVVQEGIRFTRPAGSRDGHGGGYRYAVWGQSSREYFLAQGVPDERIEITGCPRFDLIAATDWTGPARRAVEEHGLRPRTLLFLSNPIDDLGFTSTAGKLALFRRFCTGIAGVFDDPEFGLAVKLHGRESPRLFEESIASLPYAQRISIVRNGELYPLIAASCGAVMFGSTAGLEVLLLDKPLAVLELPGHGFVHDFVSAGAACGLSWSLPLGDQLRAWLTGPSAAGRRGYIERAVADPGTAYRRVAELILESCAGG